MKQILLYLTIVACGLFVCCKGKDKETDKPVIPAAQRTSLHENHLLGEVKSVTDTKYMVLPFPDGHDSLVFFSTKYDTYTRNGDLSSSVITNTQGDTVYAMTATFDNNGRMTRSDIFDYLHGENEYTLYFYDDKGHRVKEDHYIGDSLDYEHICTNDPSGNVEQMTVRQDNDTYILNYYYGDNGLPIRIEWISPRMGNDPYQCQSLQYDNRGNVINRSATLNGRNVEYYHAQYNDNGLLIKEIGQKSLPNILEEIVTEYSQHDSHGNWTLQKNTKNNIPNYIIERKIEYYH